MGAADPTSGTISLLEIVRGYGALLRRGWKPLRTSTQFTTYLSTPPRLTFVSYYRQLGR